MRGAPRAHPRRLRGDGIIPAYAGSTHTRPRIDVPHGDHPRVCGEHLVAVVLLVLPVGSSPRMRGAPRAGAPAANTGGIIPAYAGSTGQRVAKNAPRRDHPRVCGEHQGSAPPSSSARGSSPRMRGAHVGVAPDHLEGGIIPAYAGSTLASPPTRTGTRDHPRVCGEHTSRAATLFVILMQRNHFLQALAAPPRSFNISQRCPRLYPGSSLSCHP